MNEKTGNIWSVKYESYKDLFIACFINSKTEEKKLFVIHELKNDTSQLVDFIVNSVKNKDLYVTYGGEGFEMQITEFIFKNRVGLKEIRAVIAANYISKEQENNKSIMYAREKLRYSNSNSSVKFIDLAKLNGLECSRSRHSLEWAQVSLKWEKVTTEEYYTGTNISNKKQIQKAINIVSNNLKFINDFYLKNKDSVDFRGVLEKRFSGDFYNVNESGMIRNILRTVMLGGSAVPVVVPPKSVNVTDLILPYVDFTGEKMKSMHNYFKSSVIYTHDLKGSLNYTVRDAGLNINYGLGGVHSSRKPGIYTPGEDMIVMSSDVNSYYVSMMIHNDWYPAGVGKDIFLKTCRSMREKRYSKEDDASKADFYKRTMLLIAGDSNYPKSFMYDPELTIKVSINGQLLMSMLYEEITTKIPGSMMLMTNTDGVEFLIEKENKEKYIQVCKEWEEKTGMELKHSELTKLVIKNVNNYMSVNSEGSVKCVGEFGTKKLINNNNDLEIVRKAVYNFFLENKTPEDTIKENRNILDYCMHKRPDNSSSFFVTEGEVGGKIHSAIRYFATTDVSKKIRSHDNTTSDLTKINKNTKGESLVNRLTDEDFNNYNVDERYYLDIIYKKIGMIQKQKIQQLNLF